MKMSAGNCPGLGWENTTDVGKFHQRHKMAPECKGGEKKGVLENSCKKKGGTKPKQEAAGL